MTKRQNRAPRSPWMKRGAVGLTAGTLALGAGFGAAPAFAADNAVEDVNFSWTINAEVGSGAYFGGCNFLVAGAAGDAEGSVVWTESHGLYASESGNVTITKPDADGNQVQPTWATKCQDAGGTTVATGNGLKTKNQVNFSAGTGTVDAAADNATISWDGDFTIVFYGGMTYWTVSDPVLTIVDGDGTLTGIASGYGAAMDDPSKWVSLEPESIDLATFSNVDVTDTGIAVTPDYYGVAIETSGDMPEQSTAGDNWGSFPQSFVDFNVQTGQFSYWYSSGGAADPRKPAEPFSVAYTAAAVEAPEGNVDVTIPEDNTEEPTEPTEPTGSFEWAWNAEDVVDLGTATQTDEGFAASGTLSTVTVTDTREGGEDGYSWSLSGSATDFSSGTNTFSGSFLGWSPSVTSDSAAVVAGNTVTPGADATNDGLAVSKTLASSTAAASATVQAGLDLLVPNNTPAGSYSATLTVTALSE